MKGLINKGSFWVSMVAIAGMMTMQSCSDSNSNQAQNDSDNNEPKISITPFSNSPSFNDAELDIESVKGVVEGDSVVVTIKYKVEHYELGAQTDDAAQKGCNNSKDGQHIHFILDNRPYTALYKPEHTFKVGKNTEHYIMSFLSRSYHESIKNDDAFEYIRLRTDADGHVTVNDDLEEPALFYSRPKGDYVGADTANLLLDFYLANVELNNNYGVKVTVANKTNGRTIDTTLNAWQAYSIQNLGTGHAIVTLTLVDQAGNPVGVNNIINRDFTLAASAPLP